MQFSVVTPSFRNSSWLKLCIPSVADQGADSEHIIQDSQSDDGTADWLPRDPRVRAYIEKDQGMYDGINRGLRRAQGEILSYLNCDEQYLPGALQLVASYFERNPTVEILFGDVLIVDPRGDYLCHRQAAIPARAHTMVSRNLAILTCATFFRRSLIDRHGLFFDPAWKNSGDGEWIIRLLGQKVKMGLLGQWISIFTDTGENLNLRPSARHEQDLIIRSAPAWARWGRKLVILHFRLRKLWLGHYQRRKPFSYALYTHASPDKREVKQAANPTYRWRRSTSKI